MSGFDLPCQGEGREFKSRLPLHKEPRDFNGRGVFPCQRAASPFCPPVDELPGAIYTVICE